MAEKAENIKRIMSSFLRMIGGRIKWLNGVIHFRNEEDTAYNSISAGKADLDTVALQNLARDESVNLKADPNTQSYDLILPQEIPPVGATLQVADIAGRTVWTNAITTSGTYVFEEIQMNAYITTYDLSWIPNDSPIQAFVNGIEVDFTKLVNTITITTYSAGDIVDSDVLKVYYYH